MSDYKEGVPDVSAQAVLSKMGEIPEGTPVIKGFNWDEGVKDGQVDYKALLESYLHSGFQASSFGQAVNTIKEMRKWRLSDQPVKPDDDIQDKEERSKYRAKIFLGYTSNLISAGTRETFRYLAKNKMVDVIVTTAGGVEEDFIKCLGNTYMGDFAMKGKDLRDKGVNRIGNMLVPNGNYCKFQEWIVPIFNQMLKEQEEDGVNWTPSKMIHRLGKEIDNEDSVYYWCYKNNIPVYSPALTDGSIGDMLYFNTYATEKQLRLDIIEDIRRMNNEAVKAYKTGVIILGGGLVKHHIMNANLMRNGSDFAVLVNTAQEFDGSDAGARPDEAISWGKIKIDAKPVKVYSEATLAFPLLVAQTFAEENHEQFENTKVWHSLY